MVFFVCSHFSSHVVVCSLRCQLPLGKYRCGHYFTIGRYYTPRVKKYSSVKYVLCGEVTLLAVRLVGSLVCLLKANTKTTCVSVKHLSGSFVLC